MGTYPVEVYGKEGEFFSDYSGLSLTGRCGHIDGSRSEQRPKEYPGGLFPAWAGLYFDERSWDGSDFFMTSDPKGWKLVTEEVVRAFRKAKVKGASFEVLSKTEFSFNPG